MTPDILPPAMQEIANETGFDVRALTPYQFRIEGVLDIYPTKRKWHDIRKNKRGTYDKLLLFVQKHFSAPVAATCPKCKHCFFLSL